MTSYVCTVCGATNKGRGTRTCAQCRIDTIDDYLTVGIDADRIAADIDTTPAALERQMVRYGRNDLARIFRKAARHDYRARDLARRHPCVDCGRLVRARSTRCKSCNARWFNTTTDIRRTAA